MMSFASELDVLRASVVNKAHMRWLWITAILALSLVVSLWSDRRALKLR
jgi:hypothetical protein